MPELGDMKRGQPAALLGVAPFDRDSGQFKGLRFIAGGRARPRRMLYLAALSAKRFDPGLKAFAQRLTNAGKPAKLVIVAVMRKLIEAANLVLARGQPWVPQTSLNMVAHPTCFAGHLLPQGEKAPLNGTRPQNPLAMASGGRPFSRRAKRLLSALT